MFRGAVGSHRRIKRRGRARTSRRSSPLNTCQKSRVKRRWTSIGTPPLADPPARRLGGQQVQRTNPTSVTRSRTNLAASGPSPTRPTSWNVRTKYGRYSQPRPEPAPPREARKASLREVCTWHLLPRRIVASRGCGANPSRPAGQADEPAGKATRDDLYAAMVQQARQYDPLYGKGDVVDREEAV